MIGAAVYEIGAGQKCWPYHYHHGVEEWLYVVSGAPRLRDPSGERALDPGELVAFAYGPEGAHAVQGPGRVVIFSAGARGWGEAFVTVYPDSDKIGAAPGVMFRRADAIETRLGDAGDRPAAPGDLPGAGPRGRTWTAKRHELAPGEATAPYRYEWCREQWALVVSGAPTLRHADGESGLGAGDICCFPEGPTGARQLVNNGQEPSQLIVFSSPAGRPMSAFYPDEDAVLVSISDDEGYMFRRGDGVEDYWDGE